MDDTSYFTFILWPLFAFITFCILVSIAWAAQEEE